jgi:hypothetical protein
VLLETLSVGATRRVHLCFRRRDSGSFRKRVSGDVFQEACFLGGVFRGMCFRKCVAGGVF